MLVNNTQFRAFKLGMPLDAKELTVFHGTAATVATKIIQSGFDWRYNQRHAYGKGNYFATTVEHALGIAAPEGGFKTIIVAKIVYSKAAKGESIMVLPPEGFDATVDDERRPNIYVTYKVCSPVVHCRLGLMLRLQDGQSVPIARITFWAPKE